MHKQDHKYCYQLHTNQLDNAEMNKCLDMYNQPKLNQTEVKTLNRPKMRRKIPLICVHPRESTFVLHFLKNYLAHYGSRLATFPLSAKQALLLTWEFARLSFTQLRRTRCCLRNKYDEVVNKTPRNHYLLNILSEGRG